MAFFFGNNQPTPDIIHEKQIDYNHFKSVEMQFNNDTNGNDSDDSGSEYDPEANVFSLGKNRERKTREGKTKVVFNQTVSSSKPDHVPITSPSTHDKNKTSNDNLAAVAAMADLLRIMIKKVIMITFI